MGLILVLVDGGLFEIKKKKNLLKNQKLVHYSKKRNIKKVKIKLCLKFIYKKRVILLKIATSITEFPVEY